MVSAAEQFAANLKISSFSKAKDLKRRILFTILLLLVYRFGTYIPLPGVDPVAFAKAFAQQSRGVLGMFNMLAGGAVERMAIFALGIMPYISASIIIQLMTAILPSLEALKKEGELGRKMINQYTRYATVFLAIIQSFGISASLLSGDGIVLQSPVFFHVSTIITLTGGTIFLMWLGEQITARGIGNGISLIIFSGIIAGLPSALGSMLELGRTGSLSTSLILAVLVLCVFLIAMIVFFERAQRRILIQYPKRQVGNNFFQGDKSHLPLKLNTAGVIPPIFASSLLLLPATFANLVTPDSLSFWFRAVVVSLGHGNPVYMFFYALMIFFFAFFYTAIVFDPKETADQLKKHSGFIPGYRPGERTAEYIDYVLTRITVVGAIYLVLVCLLPEFLISATGIPFYLGGTSLLIVVSVTLDTITQIQGYMMAHQYEDLIKKSKLRGGKKKR